MLHNRYKPYVLHTHMPKTPKITCESIIMVIIQYVSYVLDVRSNESIKKPIS